MCASADISPSAAARRAILALLNTFKRASWALTQTGCAGHHPLRAHERRSLTHRLRLIGPSMASTTLRMEACRPREEISNPPEGPRREVTSPARVRPCRTLERKLSGAPVASAMEGKEARSPGLRAAR